MTEIPAKTVVILGAGATLGSGYTRGGNSLPGDRGFFQHPAVRQLLPECPALNIMLGFFRRVHGDDLAGVGLEEVWTFLEFASKDPYRSLADITEERRVWLERMRAPESRTDDEHCLCTLLRDDGRLPRPDDIDMHLLASWDLRRLLQRVYREVAAPADDHNVYRLLLEKFSIPANCATTFISLNYDLILEVALPSPGLPWHYVHVPTRIPRDADGVQIIKPHGSLNWLFRGNVPSVSISTDYRLEPVVNRSFEVNRFEEALIVPPTQLKQMINVRETQAPETTELLSKLWKSMAEALKGASRVFIIGYSFPSTDHHLRTLLYQVNHERGGRTYDEVHCCTQADGGHGGMVFANANRFFPAVRFHPHDRGFADFVS